MNLPLSASPRRKSWSTLACVLALAPCAALAQSADDSGAANSSSGGATSQTAKDVSAARQAGGGNRGAGNAATGPGLSSGPGLTADQPGGTGSAGTGSSGTGASGTGSGVPDNSVDAVERSRSRALPGARPNTGLGERPGGPAVTDLPPGVTDLSRDDPAVGTSVGSQPGARLGGLPSDGVRDVSRSTEPARPRADPSETVGRIAETEFVSRDRAMTAADRELSAGDAQTSRLRREAANLSGAERLRLNGELRRVGEARTEYAKAISRARSANQNRWEGSRREVVERYQDYVQALETAEDAAAQAGAPDETAR